MLSSLLLVLFAMGATAAMTTPSSECAYLSCYLGNDLLPSLLPSINSACIAALNSVRLSGNASASCIPECRSFYAVYSQCARVGADIFATSYCGQFSAKPCSDLTSMDYDLVFDVYAACNGNSTYCAPSCESSIFALEAFSGCCRYGDLNGPKALCGQQPIAPCISVLSGGGPAAAPSRECAYFNHYGDPSLNAMCRAGSNNPNNKPDVCIAECRSLLELASECQGELAAAAAASIQCGMHDNESCATLRGSFSNYTTLLHAMYASCSNSTYCPPSCIDAISSLEQYGGCCFSDALNGPKALCGQPPIAHCTAIFTGTSSDGSSSAIGGSSALLTIAVFLCAVYERFM